MNRKFSGGHTIRVKRICAVGIIEADLQKVITVFIKNSCKSRLIYNVMKPEREISKGVVVGREPIEIYLLFKDSILTKSVRRRLTNVINKTFLQPKVEFCSNFVL